MAEALRAKIDRKSEFYKGVDQYRVEQDVPNNHLYTDR